MTALTCSTLLSKTSTSLITSYALIIGLFGAPVAAKFFANTFFVNTAAIKVVNAASALSPFAATFALPLNIERGESGNLAAAKIQAAGELPLFLGHVGWTLAYNLVLLGVIVWLFHARWRVSHCY